MSYVEKTARTDGTNDYFRAGGKNIGSGQSIFGFFSINFTGIDSGENQVLFRFHEEGTSIMRGNIQRINGDELRFRFIDSSADDAFNFDVNFDFTPGQWYLFAFNLMSADQAGSSVFISNNTTKAMEEATLNVTTWATRTLNWSNVDISYLAHPDGTRHMDAAIGDFYFNMGSFDWKVPANMAKIWTSGNGLIGGCPVDRGANGELVTGSSPPIFFSGDHTDLQNKGTIGAFTQFGAPLTAEPTSPSDGCDAVTIKSFTMQASNARSTVPGGQESYAFTNADGIGNIQDS